MFSRSASLFQSVLFRDYPLAKLVVLNREKALNSLNVEMVELMLPEYRKLHHLPAQSVVVVMKGAGSKAFCAGGDVVSIVKDDPPGTQKRFFYREYQLDYSVMTLPQVHVALWDGIVMGGGVGISVHGSHRVATEKAVFAMPETAIGLFPDVGGSWFLPRLPHEGLGLFLALTGQRLKGADLFHAGIATHFVRSDRIPELEQALCTIDNAHPRNVEAVLNAVKPAEIPESSLTTQLPLIRTFFSQQNVESIEGLLANLTKDGSDWSMKQVDIMKKCSPTSLKSTLLLHKKGADAAITRHEIFTMEYFASQRKMELPDFKAGVTALLIDKTGQPPVWSPAKLEEVSDELVQSHVRATSQDTPVWHPDGDFPERTSKL